MYRSSTCSARHCLHAHRESLGTSAMEPWSQGRGERRKGALLRDGNVPARLGHDGDVGRWRSYNAKEPGQSHRSERDAKEPGESRRSDRELAK
jgi:hypothetical protein